jgi:hypothetical protein
MLLNREGLNTTFKGLPVSKGGKLRTKLLILLLREDFRCFTALSSMSSKSSISSSMSKVASGVEWSDRLLLETAESGVDWTGTALLGGIRFGTGPEKSGRVTRK